MKYALILLGLAFSLSTEAGEPTKNELDAFETALEIEREKDMWFFQTDEPCFYEHICTMSSVGKRPDCESQIKVCMMRAADDRDELNELVYTRYCRPLFAELTPAQHQMIAAPRFCEKPPPPIAFKPTFAPSEVACFCEKRGKLDGLEKPETYQRCLRDVDKCTRDMRVLSPPERASCRKKRDIALGGHTPWFSSTAFGSCKLVLDYPVLWDESQSISATSVRSAQTLERSHPELKDESDLDELGF